MYRVMRFNIVFVIKQRENMTKLYIYKKNLF